MNETFVCCLCFKTFPKGNDEEAAKEYKENFGDQPRAEGLSCCDDCYKNIALPEEEKRKAENN